MADTFQNEVPKARINLKLSLHTGGSQKKVELPLKLLRRAPDGSDAGVYGLHPKIRQARGEARQDAD